MTTTCICLIVLTVRWHLFSWNQTLPPPESRAYCTTHVPGMWAAKVSEVEEGTSPKPVCSYAVNCPFHHSKWLFPNSWFSPLSWECMAFILMWSEWGEEIYSTGQYILWFICGSVAPFTDLYCGFVACFAGVTPLSSLNRMLLGVGTQFVFDE